MTSINKESRLGLKMFASEVSSPSGISAQSLVWNKSTKVEEKGFMFLRVV